MHGAGMSAVVIETRRSFTPAEVDEMELWVIAELLTVGDTADSEPGAPVSEAEWFARAADLNAERVRRHAAGLPPPEAPASATPSVTPAMIEAVRKRGAERRARRAEQQASGG